MPARNTVKQYRKDSYYHVYNRGVEERIIFMDTADYDTFLSYLQTYLTPKDTEGLKEKLADTTLSSVEKQKLVKTLRMNNFSGEITLLAYSLLPDHFHLFFKQKSAQSLDKFMNSLLTRYVMYFNRKHKRVGRLFQSVYKAAVVEELPEVLHMSAYIHKYSGDETKPSSYPDYMGTKTTEWLNPSEVLFYFYQTYPQLSYKTFLEQTTDFSLISESKIDDHTDAEITELLRQPLEKPAKSNFFRGLFGK